MPGFRPAETHLESFVPTSASHYVSLRQVVFLKSQLHSIEHSTAMLYNTLSSKLQSTRWDAPSNIDLPTFFVKSARCLSITFDVKRLCFSEYERSDLTCLCNSLMSSLLNEYSRRKVSDLHLRILRSWVRRCARGMNFFFLWSGASSGESKMLQYIAWLRVLLAEVLWISKPANAIGPWPESEDTYGWKHR